MNKKGKVLSLSKGFTLIESLVSIAIFSMMALVVYQAFFFNLQKCDCELGEYNYFFFG